MIELSRMLEEFSSVKPTIKHKSIERTANPEYIIFHSFVMGVQ